VAAKIYDVEYPKMTGSFPGPKVQQVLHDRGSTRRGPTLITKYAEGVWLQDLDDNLIYDFISARCTVNVGHRHQVIQEAVKSQLEKVTHGLIVDSHEVLKSLDSILPLSGEGKTRVSYTLSGSAANDAAIKMARAVSGKRGIICFAGAYHGVTYGALSISSYTSSMFQNYGRLNDIFYFPYPDYAHSPFKDMQRDRVDDIIIGLIQIALDTYMPADEVAAIIFEPVEGDAGWLVPSYNFVKKLHKLARDNDILFISEEVQTGFGRTGEWFCIEHFDVKPDIIVMGKAMAGVAAKESTLSKGSRFSHGHTMSSNPLGQVATQANIKVIKDEKLCKQSASNGRLIMKHLLELENKVSSIVENRGIGSLIGVEVSSKYLAGEIVQECLKKGISMVQMGYRGTGVLRIAPPANKHTDTTRKCTRNHKKHYNCG